ncbi:MAG: prepilin-type N-terminal cleavage/methylation domain-containing protein [Planctomycetota bacterium]|nr:prepilin-type N-terminal cleavage/methylation domain-containing protein [Planctomycetota bacterium]
MKAQKGFTLVEILIVVVILGILAAIVVPQFTQASTEAKYNSLCSNLQSMRSQIELYKVQHNDEAPDTDPVAQLVYTTDVAGNVSDPQSKARTGDFQYGPYLERIPANPFNNLDTIRVVAAKGAAAGTHGWVLVQETGEIYADNEGTIPNDDATNFSDL